MYIFIFASAMISCNMVLGSSPVLHSSIGSQISGQSCPGNVTITCNALRFGISGILDWYINDIRLARYSYSPNDDFPVKVALESQILNATVQISSVLLNGTFDFLNFTLNVDLEDLLHFQGQAISCGTVGVRSNVFSINNFTLSTVQNISYVAKSQGYEGKWTEIIIQWIDGLKLAMCEVTTFYIVQLIIGEEVISIETLSTEDCTIFSQCSVQFNSSDLDRTADSYDVKVMAYDQRIENNFTSLTTIPNTTGNLIRNNTCNGTALITCSTSFGENCLVEYTSNTLNSVIIKPGDTYILAYMVHLPNIEIIINMNSTALIQTFSIYPDGRLDSGDGAIFGFGIAIFAFGFILLALGCSVGAIIFCRYFGLTKVRFIWKATFSYSIFVIIIFFITLAMWITVAVTSSEDYCGRTIYTISVLGYIAITFSIILCILGAIILGGFILSIHSFGRKPKHSDVIEEREMQLENLIPVVKFGKMGPNKENVKSTSVCDICKNSFERSILKRLVKSLKQSKVKKYRCPTCLKMVCEVCYSKEKVYIKFCKKEDSVCINCYTDYKEEQTNLLSELIRLDIQQFGAKRLPSQPRSNQCHECEDIATDFGYDEAHIAEITCCCTCGNWVCNECFDDHKVEYLQEGKKMCEKVCINCYAIYRMASTSGSSTDK